MHTYEPEKINKDHPKAELVHILPISFEDDDGRDQVYKGQSAEQAAFNVVKQ